MTEPLPSQTDKACVRRIASFLRNMSIRRKLVSITLLTCASALLLSGVVFIAWEYGSLERTMVQDFHTHARVLAENCRVSLAFEDAQDASNTLKAFQAVPSVVLACVYTKEDRLLSAYFRDGLDAKVPPAHIREDGHVFESGFLTTFEPVILDGEKVGTVCIRSDLDLLRARLRRNVAIIASVLALSFLAAYLISSKLQKVISGPILSLAGVANLVSQKKEYSTRAQKHSNDEIGLLIDAFNEMLEQIQDRDSALVTANERLEARVQERTAELTAANEQLTREMAFRKRAEQVQKQRTERIIRHQAVLLRLHKMTKGDLEHTIRLTTEELAKTIDVERVGLWLFNQDKSQLVCRDLYKNGQQQHERGLTISVGDYPLYFEAVESSRIVAAKDAAEDPRTAEFRETYLEPLGIVSMMDVPIRLHGKVVGVVSHEHTGPPREWTLEEQDFVASVADMMSLQLEAAERRKAELALEKANRSLAETVQELKRSNKELQDFAYVTAHDLKAPLRAIGTLTDWIASDYAHSFDDPGRQQMQLLKGRVARMNDLIDSILRYSEIGRGAKHIEKVRLDALVPEIIAQISLPENVEVIIETPLPVLVAEKARLVQVFQNLIDNAVKHNDKPARSVRIACTEETDHWKFSVADNGPGIEPKYFDKIFKMFQTLVRRDEIESVGIGLAVVKKIVELSGGKVWVESELGQGSTFLFTLPRQDQDHAASPQPAGVSRQQSTPADVDLDCTHLSCPMPIVKLSQAISQMQPGQTIAVEATDGAFSCDIRAWTESTGHELLQISEGPVQRALIRKSE